MRAQVKDNEIWFRCASPEEAQQFAELARVANYVSWVKGTAIVKVFLPSSLSWLAAVVQRELGCDDSTGYQIAAWLLFAEPCPNFKQIVGFLRGNTKGVTNTNAEVALLREIYRSPLLRQIETATRFLSTALIPYWSKVNEGD